MGKHRSGLGAVGRWKDGGGPWPLLGSRKVGAWASMFSRCWGDAFPPTAQVRERNTGIGCQEREEEANISYHAESRMRPAVSFGESSKMAP